jgi:hypothetical protein
MSAFFAISKNDVLPVIQSQLSSNGAVTDISSATGVYFCYKKRYYQTSGSNDLTIKQGEIVSGSNGLVKYEWQSSDTSGSNVYKGRWRVYFPNEEIMSFPNDGYMSFQIFDI